MVYKVVFLRHGESEWNVANIFTGWVDVDLSAKGKQEAIDAGKMLKEQGFKFDILFTSVLKRSIKTAWTALMESDNVSIPHVQSWRLNERHYGDLQGKNKAETAAKYGDEQVKIWRRSYDIPPPPIDMSDSRHPGNDPMYLGTPKNALPGAESLKITVDRVLPFWNDSIAPCILAGKSVVVVAHGNSLRALCKHLEGMSEKDVLELNLPTSVPLVYELDENLKFISKRYLLDEAELKKRMDAVANQGKAAPATTGGSDIGPAMIYQLGTNNWQRLKKDGTGELEFAPGSGVLHEAHHNAYNEIPGIKSYSMYPSKNQAQPTEANADYRVFELDHDIPICESASPNSSKRWHGFSEEEFSAYVKRMENDVYDHMLKCEEKEGKKFTHMIAHHSFINPLACRNVVQRRAKEGISPPIPIYCFVHGTALKMYRWELGPKETDEQKTFPMRFHSMIKAEKLFDDQVNGINACFVISTEQKGGIKEIFPEFPQDRVIVAPNGINVEKFKPRELTLEQVVVQQTRNLIWPAVPPEDEVKKYKRVVVFVGKYAEWKRQAALLYAASAYESKFPDVATLCAGTGPEDEKAKIIALCEELGLKNTFLLGARSQDELAEMYTIAQMGVFPSFKEPFGLVFVECMACKTPVIGANSGGPKDFVSPEVGELVAEPPETHDLGTVPLGVKTLGKTLDETISRALNENWKEKKGAACIKLAHDRFTVAAQVKQMLIDIKKLG